MNRTCRRWACNARFLFLPDASIRHLAIASGGDQSLSTKKHWQESGWTKIGTPENKYRKYLSIITWWRDVRVKLDNVPGSEFERELVHITSDTMSWIKAGKVPWWECLSILHICAKLKHYEPRLVALLSAKLLQGKNHTMADLDPTQTPKLIYSLGVLKGLSNKTDRMDGEKGSAPKLVFIEALATAVHRMGLEKINTFGLANIAYGVGKWGRMFSKSAPSTFRTLSYECIQADRLETYTEQGLATVIYSLGIMGTDKTAIMVPLVVESCRRKRLEAFTEQHFSSIVYGLGLVGFDKHAKLLPLVEEAMQTKNLKRFKPQGLCNFLHGLAKMHFKNDKLFLPMMYESISRSKKGQMTPFQVASFIQSSGCLISSEHSIVDMLVDCVSDSPILQEMTARSLANVACAFAKLKVHNSQAWTKVYQNIDCVIRAHHSNATELGAICWAVAQSRYFDPKLLRLLLRSLMRTPQKPSETFLKAITQALYACRQYSFADIEFLGFVRASVIQAEDLLSDWDIIDYAWTLCVLDTMTMEEFKLLCVKLQRAPSAEPPDMVKDTNRFSEMVVSIDAYMHCRFSKAGDQLLPKLGFRETRYRQLKGAKKKQPPNIKPSQMRLEVHDMLVKLGYCCELDVLVENYFIDFRLNGDGGHLLVVADQAAHFHDIVRAEERLLGPLSFQLNLLGSLKHKVCCIEYHQWDGLNDEDRQRLLEGLLDGNESVWNSQEWSHTT